METGRDLEFINRSLSLLIRWSTWLQWLIQSGR